MKETFATKYGEWQIQYQECTKAVWVLGNTTEQCEQTQSNVSSQTKSCDEQLGTIESLACAWASASGSRCSAYETCYSSALAKYNEKVAEVPAAIAKWKESWIAAQRTKCMASCISSEGVVDTAKMLE